MEEKLKFYKPPIIELICGIQFDSIPVFFPVASEFYDIVKTDFSKVEEMTPMKTQFDFSSLDYLTKKPFIIEPIVRYWFINEKGERLIQLQNNRFYFNWRKNDNEDNIYPHFNQVFINFFDYYNKLKIVSNNFQSGLSINQLELTYIDHINIEDFSDSEYIPDIFNFINSSELIKNIDNFSLQLSSPVEICKGHYNLNIFTAHKGTDKKLILVMESSIRGMLKESSEENFTKWFENAHSVILSKFLEQISDKSKTLWQLQH